MSKFKVGDRVRVKSNLKKGKLPCGLMVLHCMEQLRGRFVTISSVMERSATAGGDRYRVEQSVWSWSEDCFESPSHKILITTDGKSTLARLYDGKKVVKTAEAKCAQGDTFNFDTGAGIAFDRLMGREKPATVKAVEPKYWSGKVVCVARTDEVLTAGKVYDIRNGVITWDDGVQSETCAKTLKDFNAWFLGGSFIEYKGEA